MSATCAFDQGFSSGFAVCDPVAVEISGGGPVGIATKPRRKIIRLAGETYGETFTDPAQIQQALAGVAYSTAYTEGAIVDVSIGDLEMLAILDDLDALDDLALLDV